MGLRSWLWDRDPPDLPPLFERPVFLPLGRYDPRWVPWHRFEYVSTGFRLGPLCVVCGESNDWAGRGFYRARFVGIPSRGEVCRRCFEERLVWIRLPVVRPMDPPVTVSPVRLSVHR